jgi:hypothetical protein
MEYMATATASIESKYVPFMKKQSFDFSNRQTGNTSAVTSTNQHQRRHSRLEYAPEIQILSPKNVSLKETYGIRMQNRENKIMKMIENYASKNTKAMIYDY